MKKIMTSVFVLGLFLVGVSSVNAAGLVCTTTHPTPNSTVTTCKSETQTSVTQNNVAVVNNSVSVSANTGGNVGGSIRTGNATVRVRIFNLLNTNQKN